MSSLEVGRERIIQLLCAQYGNDALTTQELEARFAIAYRATSEVELQAALINLPALPSSSSPPALPAPRPALPTSRRARSAPYRRSRRCGHGHVA